MNDLLENDAIKQYTQSLITKNDIARQETESIIAFLEKNYKDIKVLVDTGVIERDSKKIIAFVNKTCKTNIYINKDIEKFINKKFGINWINIDLTNYIPYILSYSIMLTFWVILLRILNGIAFWWNDMSWSQISTISFSISTIVLFFMIIFSKKPSSD